MWEGRNILLWKRRGDNSYILRRENAAPAIIPRSVKTLKLKDMPHFKDRTTRSKFSMFHDGFIEDANISYTVVPCGRKSNKSSPIAVPIKADIKMIIKIYKIFIFRIVPSCCLKVKYTL